MFTMSESNTLDWISTYISENKLKTALEAEVKYMVIEAKENKIHLAGPGIDFELQPPDKNHVKVIAQRLKAIYDDNLWVLRRIPQHQISKCWRKILWKKSNWETEWEKGQHILALTSTQISKSEYSNC